MGTSSAKFPDKNELKRFARNFVIERIDSLQKYVMHCLQQPFASFPAILYCVSIIDLLGALCADLSYANLRGAKLLDTTLSKANLRGAFLNRINLSNTDLSNADFSSSIIIGCEEYGNALIGENTNFDNAIVDRKELLKYLNNKNAANVPPSIEDKYELEEKLKERRFSEEEIMRLLTHSTLPTR